jgi:hypothetical protein
MSPPQAWQSRIILLAAYDETPALNRQYHTLFNRPRATIPQAETATAGGSERPVSAKVNFEKVRETPGGLAVTADETALLGRGGLVR